MALLGSGESPAWGVLERFFGSSLLCGWCRGSGIALFVQGNLLGVKVCLSHPNQKGVPINLPGTNEEPENQLTSVASHPNPPLLGGFLGWIWEEPPGSD